MSAPTIAALVTANWPNTEAFILAKAAASYTVAKPSAIYQALRQVLGKVPVPSAPDALDEVIKQQVADTATLALLRIGRDVLLDTPLSRVINAQSGNNGSEGLHDKVAALEDLRRDLDAAIKRRALMVEGLLALLFVPPTTVYSDVPMVVEFPGLAELRRKVGWK